MIINIIYPGEPAAGLISHYFELDFGDILDQSLEDDREEGSSDNRQFIKNKISELVEGIQDSGFRISFEDECPGCGQLMEELKSFRTNSHGQPVFEPEYKCPNPHCVENIEIPDLGEG